MSSCLICAMGKLFNLESPFWRFVGKLADAVILNIIWILFSLPIITIGASTTALYYCAMKVAKDREGSSLLRDFWKSFKLNFKQATILWLICLALLAFFALDIYFYWGMNNQLSTILCIIFVVFTAVLCCTMFYLFPLQAKFYNPIRKTISFALVMQIRYFHYTLLMALIAAAVAVGTFFYVPVGIFGMGLIAFLQSYCLNKIFEKYAPEEDPEEAERKALSEDDAPRHVIMNEQTTAESGAGIMNRANLGSLSGAAEASTEPNSMEEASAEPNSMEEASTEPNNTEKNQSEEELTR